ncbi:MAG: GNAT family N-acetyltransferase [Bacteroidota bacterium]
MEHAVPKINLRHANIDDLSLLIHWDQQQHVIDSDPDDDWEWEKELPRNVPWREQLVAELDGKPIGFIQIIDPHEEETHYWGTVEPNLRAIDIWIGESHNLGKGYGTRMMELAVKRCFDNPNIKEILIDPLESNKRAHKFYERLGFQFAEERKFNDSTCYIYRLTREMVSY